MPRKSVQNDKIRMPGPPAALVEELNPVWTPLMSVIAAIIVAFLAGMFVGQEFLHTPNIVTVSATSQGSGSHSADASSSTMNATVPDDSGIRRKIAKASTSAQLITMAHTFIQDQKPDLAILAFNRAIELGANSSEVYRSRAMMYIAEGRSNEAESDLRTALKLDPNDARTHAALGVLLAKLQRDPAQAREEFQKALSLSPPPEVKAVIETELSHL